MKSDKAHKPDNCDASDIFDSCNESLNVSTGFFFLFFRPITH